MDFFDRLFHSQENNEQQDNSKEISDQFVDEDETNLYKIESAVAEEQVDDAEDDTEDDVQDEDLMESVDYTNYSWECDIHNVNDVKSVVDSVSYVDDFFFMYVDYYNKAIQVLKSLIENNIEYEIDGVSTNAILYTLVRYKQTYYQALIENEYDTTMSLISNCPYDMEKQESYIESFVKDILDYRYEFNHATLKCAEIHLDKIQNVCGIYLEKDYKEILNESSVAGVFGEIDKSLDIDRKRYETSETKSLETPILFFAIKNIKDYSLYDQINNGLALASGINDEDKIDFRLKVIELLIAQNIRRINKCKSKIDEGIDSFNDRCNCYTYYLHCVDEIFRLNALLEKPIVEIDGIERIIEILLNKIMDAFNEQIVPILKNAKNMDEFVEIVVLSQDVAMEIEFDDEYDNDIVHNICDRVYDAITERANKVLEELDIQ